MKKSEQIRQRTWNYFWQQKTKEISYIALIILGLFFVQLVLGGLVLSDESKYCSGGWDIIEKCTNFDIWSFGFLIILVFFFFGFFIFGGIYLWIKLNWKKAEERAIGDFE